MRSTISPSRAMIQVSGSWRVPNSNISRFLSCSTMSESSCSFSMNGSIALKPSSSAAGAITTTSGSSRARRSDSSSSEGASSTHGGHQVAQKFTSTILPR
jgi:hypothetical protein